MLFKRVDTVFVPVRNMEISQEWYARVLGLTVGGRSGDGRYLGLSVPSDQPNLTGVTLIQTATYRKADRSYFNFFVSPEDVETVREQLIQQGVTVTAIQSRRSSNMRIFSMLDPDGNKIGICSWAEAG